MLTSIGWRIKTPKSSFEKFNQLVQANIPAELKKLREYWQIKDCVNKRGQQLCFIEYYELLPYV
jgi:ABC-type Na+ transport system ATPase subunit NatA